MSLVFHKVLLSSYPEQCLPFRDQAYYCQVTLRQRYYCCSRDYDEESSHFGESRRHAYQVTLYGSAQAFLGLSWCSQHTIIIQGFSLWPLHFKVLSLFEF